MAFLYIPYIYPPSIEGFIFPYPLLSPQRVGITSKISLSPPPPVVNPMPRARQIGITEDLKSKILHWERVPKDHRKYVAYDVRQIILKELDDLHWIVSHSRSDFRRTQDSTFTFPLEPILPSDPKKIGDTLAFLDEMTSTINLIREAVEEWGIRYTRTGRY